MYLPNVAFITLISNPYIIKIKAIFRSFEFWIPPNLKMVYILTVDFLIFKQHAASIYGFVRLFVCMLRYVKKVFNTSKQGRGLRFVMLTVLTNISSTKMSW